VEEGVRIYELDGEMIDLCEISHISNLFVQESLLAHGDVLPGLSLRVILHSGKELEFHWALELTAEEERKKLVDALVSEANRIKL
jgi:hypothetical protein